MQITIDLLSLFLGAVLGICIMGVAITVIYLDDKWDTAFGQGWECGKEYQQKKEKQDERLYGYKEE